MNEFAAVEQEAVTAYRAEDTHAFSHHFHNEYELIYIEKGRAEFLINGERRVYGEGHILFINQLEQHQMRPLSGDYIRFVVRITPDQFDRFVSDPQLRSIFKLRPSGFQHAILLPPEHTERVRAILVNCVLECQNGQSYSHLSILSNILILLIHLYRHFPEHYPSTASLHKVNTAMQVQNFLDRHYLEHLPLAELAREFHLNKFYLLEIFKEITGYTIKQYIILKRLSHAKNLLHYSDKEIAQVASESGFNSASNYIRAFKLHEGVTPLQFRKQASQK